MPEKILFITGRLAYPRLEKVLTKLNHPAFEWQIVDMGVKVAALMTENIIKRRMPEGISADRIITPGRCRADLEALSKHFGIPFERGPDELMDLPAYFGKTGHPPDLSKHDLRIFAEIVEASEITVDEVLARAQIYKDAGADIIDIGCLPDTPFPHLEDTVKALKEADFKVSVDSASTDELKRGAKAGADYLFSLTEETLWLAEETDAVPVLIPAKHTDLPSLYNAMEAMEKKGLPYMADPILDPIHFGFMASLTRYAKLREDWPDAEILMGTGNLTELTDADTTGITATLLGICSELDIRNVLVVQVSPHTHRTVEEHDAARRIMYAAKQDNALPKGYSDDLLCLHSKRPFPISGKEIGANAKEIRDVNFRIETAEDGLHIYNRDGHHSAEDCFEFFPKLGVDDDGAHAFYLGAELMRAEISWSLGKRYAQDEPLDWGVATEKREEDRTRLKDAGHTLRPKDKEEEKSE